MKNKTTPTAATTMIPNGNSKKVKMLFFGLMSYKLLLSLILGIIFGLIGSLIFLSVFPNLGFYIKRSLPISTMLMIFLRNSFLVTLICFGSIIFSLTELKVYKLSSYKILDKIFNPFYNLLGRIWKIFKELKPMYRSCYLSLFGFPLGCIFLTGFTISFYFFTTFLLGISILFLIKLLPHTTLEVFVFLISASMSLGIASKLRKYIIKKRIKKFEKESKKILKSKKVWRKLLILYVILFFSALLEKFFVECI